MSLKGSVKKLLYQHRLKGLLYRNAIIQDEADDFDKFNNAEKKLRNLIL